MSNIIDFFDPYCVKHIEAFIHLEKTGSWPKDFLNEKNYNEKDFFPCAWQAAILNKFAQAWIEQVKAGNVFGMPPF
jgi:hypothetical protein